MACDQPYPCVLDGRPCSSLSLEIDENDKNNNKCDAKSEVVASVPPISRFGNRSRGRGVAHIFGRNCLNEERYRTQTERTGAKKDVSKDEFSMYLFAALYSSCAGYHDTLLLAQKIYDLSVTPKGFKAPDRIGIDSVHYAIANSYTSFEELLDSGDFAHVVQVEHVPEWMLWIDLKYWSIHGRAKVYQYVLGLHDYQRVPWIHRLKMDRVRRNTVLLPSDEQPDIRLRTEENYLSGPLLHKIVKCPKKTVRGEIFSYEIDADSEEEDDTDQRENEFDFPSFFDDDELKDGDDEEEIKELLSRTDISSDDLASKLSAYWAPPADYDPWILDWTGNDAEKNEKKEKGKQNFALD